MDVEALRHSPCGYLVPISGTDARTGKDWHHSAYVPHPLSETPAVGFGALDAATRAAMAIARLDQASTQLPNPRLLVRPTTRREAVSTSALEGTYSTYDEVLESEFLTEQQLTSEQREVRNYIRATETAIELLESLPISRRMLNQLQEIIVKDTPDDSPEAGDLRQHQVAIGAHGRSVHEARFVPPPPEFLDEGFSDWEKWVNADNRVPVVCKMALTHYQFETLHPYHNGNGRLGRLVAVLQLITSQALAHPIVNIAPYFDQRQDAYRNHLLQVSIDGRFDPWVEFFSEALTAQAHEAVQIITDLLGFRERSVARLRAAGLRGASVDLVEHLISYPVLDVPTAARLLDRTFETANQAVSKLVQHDILREITGRRMNRLFVCPEVRRLTSVTPSRR